MRSIELQDLCFAYGPPRSKAGGSKPGAPEAGAPGSGGPDQGRFTLGPIDLTLAAGSATALVGPSGAGKSSLLRCIAGLERPLGGRILFDGEEVSSPKRVVPPHERRIGYVFQSGALWPHLTVLQHLAFAAPAAGRKAWTEMLGQVGLGGKLSRRPAQLSGGEAQRLSLCRALITGPKLLLLDEPLHSVDVHLRDELSLLVCDLARRLGVTLVVVTHDRSEALALAEDLVVLRQGRVVERGPALELLRAPRTAYVAAFLWQAACLSTKAGTNGSVASAFGALPRPHDANGELALVLMPGDVEQAEPGAANPRARVLRVEVTPAGPMAAVELEGRTVRVLCARVPAAGDIISLRLRGSPRLLPASGGAEP